MHPFSKPCANERELSTFWNAEHVIMTMSLFLSLKTKTLFLGSYYTSSQDLNDSDSETCGWMLDLISLVWLIKNSFLMVQILIIVYFARIHVRLSYFVMMWDGIFPILAYFERLKHGSWSIIPGGGSKSGVEISHVWIMRIEGASVHRPGSDADHTRSWGTVS